MRNNRKPGQYCFLIENNIHVLKIVKFALKEPFCYKILQSMIFLIMEQNLSTKAHFIRDTVLVYILKLCKSTK